MKNEEAEIISWLVQVILENNNTDLVTPAFTPQNLNLIKHPSAQKNPTPKKRSRKPKILHPIGDSDPITKGGKSSEELRRNLTKVKERRQGIAENYNTLQSKVPKLSSKVTRERILGWTVSYVRKLQREVKRLERVRNNNNNSPPQGKKMMVMMSKSSSNWNSTINVSVLRKVTFFEIQLMGRRQQGFVTRILRIFQKHDSNDGGLRLMVTASDGDHGDRDDITEIRRGERY